MQFPDWTAASFEFDEEDTLPGWAEEHRQEIQKRCTKVLEKLAAARAEYEKLCAPAGAEYVKVRDAARAEYEKVCAAAGAEYEKVRDAAGAEYEKVRAPARVEYDKVSAPAWAEFNKVRDAALAEYEKVRDAAWVELIKEFAKIPGYVPERGES